MKKNIIISALLVLTLVNCNNSKKRGSAQNNEYEIAGDSTANNRSGLSLAPVLDVVYLVNVDSQDQDNRTPVMSAPNDNSTKLFEYYLGRKISVIEYVGEWIGVLDSIEYDTYNKKLNNPIYRKVYIRKAATGSLDKFLLKENELDIINNVKDRDKKQSISHLEKDSVELHLISKEEYEKNRSLVVNHLTQDTTSIKKISGKIKLPCKDQTIILEDINSDGDNSQTNFYIGQIEDLNIYVVFSTYYEGYSYKFYDKTTGEIKAIFDEMPLLSPDKKRIVSILANVYENNADINLYGIEENDSISLSHTHHFTQWMPISSIINGKDQISYFWGNDNVIYAKIIPTKVFGFIREDMDYFHQYIKIKIKESV